MSEVTRAPDVPLDQVEWRIQGKIDRGGGVQVVAYLDAPTVSRLLDEWVGPDRWCDRYEPAGDAAKSMWCHLSVRFGDEWVTKVDLGTPSDMESAKGLVSDAFKRVAMRKWRVGANVFDLPTLRITKFDKVERPGKDPAAYLNGQSAAEIKQRLTALGFEDAAAKTRVAGTDTQAETSAAPEPDSQPTGNGDKRLCARCGEPLHGSVEKTSDGYAHRGGCPEVTAAMADAEGAS